MTEQKKKLFKLESPAAQRNKGPIWEVLQSHFDWNGRCTTTTTDCPIKVLEIAAGTGLHTYYWSDQLSKLLLSLQQKQQQQQQQQNKSSCCSVVWYPTDAEESYRDSIRAYAAERRTTNGGDSSDGVAAVVTVQPVVVVVVHEPLPLVLEEHGIQEKSTQQLLVDVAPFDLILNINMIHIAPWSATIGLMKEVAHLLAENGGTLFLYGPYKVNGTCCPSNQSFDESLQQRNPEWGVRNLEDVVAVAESFGLQLVQTIPMPANNLSLLFQKEEKSRISE